MTSENEVKSSAQELLDAQTHVWNHSFNYINSMSLRCAVQLGIPDAIHKHAKPITLSQLANALSINQAKSHDLYRLMRILVHSNFFNKVKLTSEAEDSEAYTLTGASRVLLRDSPICLAPFTLAMSDPIMMDPWHHVSEWFHNDMATPLATKHGRTFWELAAVDKGTNVMFNEAMASDSLFIANIFTTDCRQVFEGLGSMVDVGGGTGGVAKGIAAAFPGLKCTVLDLPHVVDGLESCENLRFVGGDMFEFIPRADAVFLKWILHTLNDEDCVRLLKKCKESINSGGKVIAVDLVVKEGEKEEGEASETKLFFDLMLMAMVPGRERSEGEWVKLFLAAGFTSYKINSALGLRSIIEIFP